MTATPSKGVRFHHKLIAKEIIDLRKQNKSWTRIGVIVCMDRNNARRTYLKQKRNENENLS
jgi:hypothetical protein